MVTVTKKVLAVDRTGFPSMTLTDANAMSDLVFALKAIAETQVARMAASTKKAAVEVFDEELGWKPNKPSTVARKGHDKVMRGNLTHVGAGLRDNLEARSSSPDPIALPRRFGVPLADAYVGWFGKQHPDSDLTDAELASVHEAPELYGMSGQIPARSWLTTAADTQGPRILAEAAAGIVSMVGAFNVFPTGGSLLAAPARMKVNRIVDPTSRI